MLVSTVPPAKAASLNTLKRSHKPDTLFWYQTFQAAVYCAMQSKRSDVDWYNVLLENRRIQSDRDNILQSVLHENSKQTKRGNVNRLGQLAATFVGGKYYYTRYDLDIWLAFVVPTIPAVTMH